MEELLGDIIARAIAAGKIRISFDGMECTMAELVEGECFQAIQKIQAILADDTLDDPDCFYKIEEIVCTLEQIGSNGGSRHDFG